MTYKYAVLNQFGQLHTRTLGKPKAARIALEIKGSYKAEMFEGGK